MRWDASELPAVEMDRCPTWLALALGARHLPPFGGSGRRLVHLIHGEVGVRSPDRGLRAVVNELSYLQGANKCRGYCSVASAICVPCLASSRSPPGRCWHTHRELAQSAARSR